MAFDFGLRQIGVATASVSFGASTSLPVLNAKDGVPDWNQVERVLAEWQPDLVILGEPLNMDGTDSELTPRARKFGQRIHGRFGLPVEMVDERLSSVAAKEASAERGHKGDYKKEPIDSLAAELILQTWLSENATA